MTPTTSEREAREILGREYQKAHAADPRINFCAPEFEVAVRAVMAALTREQRVGERRSTHRVFRELSSVTESLPCYCEATSDHLVGREHPQQEAQGVVAWSVFDKRSGRHWYTHDSRTTAQGYADLYSHKEADGSPSQIVTPLYAATPPAPVDVRLREAAAALCDSLEAGTDSRAHYQAVRALLDGQPAGVDDEAARKAVGDVFKNLPKTGSPKHHGRFG